MTNGISGYMHDGLPSVARDGAITASRNRIYTGGTWYDSGTFGVAGDWIIRAEILGGG